MHDIRSTHNVGSLLRTAEGLGVKKVYMSGYTPYPEVPGDKRLPHIYQKLSNQINKTALGAEKLVDWEPCTDLRELIRVLHGKGFSLIALEQNEKSVLLNKYQPPAKLALIVGNEVEGIETEVLKQCDAIVEIAMKGKKESFNVVQAAAIALYELAQK
jgi:23S rRNA (guanosine2251-2'-O)-methyltransferase